MISSYQTFDPLVNSALFLVARVLEQANLDKLSLRGSRPRRDEKGFSNTCTATYTDHPARDCATDFLNQITLFRYQNPDADHIEIALEVLRLCLR